MYLTQGSYSADLDNIEEILSIFEMEERLAGREDYRKMFTDYISDVIQYYMPGMGKANTLQTFGSNIISAHKNYPFFVGGIMNAEISYKQQYDSGKTSLKVSARRIPHPETEYAIVTLNYDTVLERIWDTLSGGDRTLSFGLKADENTVCLAKLHGTIGGKIIAPTWSKDWDDEIQEVWRVAYEALSKANQIRIIGYSLPKTDAYIQYLLKAALMDSEHLKNIDIILKEESMDSDTVRRYQEFITFKKARIANDGVEKYIGSIVGHTRGVNGLFAFDRLEAGHYFFFKDFSVNLHSRAFGVSDKPDGVADVKQTKDELADLLGKGFALDKKLTAECGVMPKVYTVSEGLSMEAHKWVDETRLFLSTKIGRLAVVDFDNSDYHVTRSSTKTVNGRVTRSGSVDSPETAEYRFIKSHIAGLKKVVSNINLYLS